MELLNLLVLYPFALVFALWASCYFYGWRLRSKSSGRKTKILRDLGQTNLLGKRFVGFFHPYCNAGGGGERVLWTAIAALQRNEPNIISVVYTGDIDVTKTQIIDKVKSRLDISLDPALLHFVFLNYRIVVEDSTWPRLTLLGQSLGSMILAWEAMSTFIPDLFIDTMGYAFTFHVVKLLGAIPVGAYVHYPTISTDMLDRVQSRQNSHTNSSDIASSATLSWAKLLYYRLFMYYYALSLRNASFIMVNSSWTKNHVDSILQRKDFILDLLHCIPPLPLIGFFRASHPPKTAQIVYPPCDTRAMVKFSLENRKRVILSIAQFRPEKDHAAQLRAFHELLKTHPEYKFQEGGVKLVLVGGSRNSEDAARVDGLQQLATSLGISPYVEFVINASYPDVLHWLSIGSIGLSTMIDEHFGINVVEFMAAGLIPVAHASGGPLKDIIVPFNGKPTGYHARTPTEFADVLHTVLTLPKEDELGLRTRARTWAAQRFSEEEFEKGWNASGWQACLNSP